MIDFKPKGAIFDVDDTLLSNHPKGLDVGLHEKSRLEAVIAVGRKHSITALENVDPELNKVAFINAKEHSLASAVWYIMHHTNVVGSEDMDPENALLKEIVASKNDMHEQVLREYGAELPGASDFVRGMASITNGNVAVASSAVRRDIDVFFSMVGLSAVFQPNRIISLESVNTTKPDPEGFNLAFESLGLQEPDRASVLAFEDVPKGVEAAKRAGLFVCAVTSRFSETDLMDSQHRPDLVFDNYSDLAGILSR